ncbi:MAG: dinitrogenase iron-molybdenum cofactor biosynthesis protein [Candidatus Portnoybacteria bacterium]|nr:dinitrogenase iron-molybdenum cofactor biosynthesis protein [Candidatus Portnoybacteria bacterium]
MKICITANGSDIDSMVDPRFGRCAYFIILDDKGKLIESISNTAGRAIRGAGITAAQLAVDNEVDIIITGNVGPNAYRALSSSGVKIFHGAFDVNVKDAFDMYKKGELEEVDSSSGFGFGPGFGRGRGPGRGFGRGLNR